MSSLGFIVRCVLVAIVILLPIVESDCAAAERTGPETAVTESAWSFDDIKDVCEAVQFMAITLGIGIASYWFLMWWLPHARSARVEFDVDVRCVDCREDARLIEVVAAVNNVGRVPVSIAHCRFTLSSVSTAGAAVKAGPLADGSSLAPLFEADLAPTGAIVEAGTCARYACPAAIPSSVTHVVVSGCLKLHENAAAVVASKLLALTGKPPV